MLHVCTWSPSYLPVVGGAEVGMHEILRALVATGRFRISVVTATTDAGSPRSEVIDGVEVRRYQRSKGWYRWLGPALSARRGLPHLDALSPDIVHVSYALPTGLAGLAAARRRDLPTVLSLVGSDVDDPVHPPPTLLSRWMWRQVRREANIVANSRWVRSRVAGAIDRGEEAIDWVPYGVDVAALRATADPESYRRRLGIAYNAPIITALQRIEPRKGTDLLVRAAVEVLQEIPDARFLIGGQGRDFEAMHELVASLGLADSVALLGHVDDEDKSSFLAAADLFVLPSHHEGLGIVLAEAASVNVPSVTTATGGVTDIVIDGETGRCCPPGDVHAMARTIIELLRSPLERTRLGTAAAARVSSQLSLEVAAARYAEVFERVARRTRRSARTASGS